MILLLTLKILGTVVACIVAVAALSFLNAIFLRFSAFALKLPSLPFQNAYLAVLISSLVTSIFSAATHYLAMLGTAVLPNFLDDRGRNSTMMTNISSVYLFYMLVLSLIVTTAVIRRYYSDSTGSTTISFSDAFALTALYQAASYLVLFVIGLLVFTVCTGIWLMLVSA